MLIFRNQIRKFLSEYKIIMRKHLSPDERNHHFSHLKIDRKSLKNSDEVKLYHAAERVIKDLEKRVMKINAHALWYSGLEEFKQTLKDFLGQYHIERHRVVHDAQSASAALVSAIQIMSLPEKKCTKSTYTQLSHLTQQIIDHGSKEQQQLFFDAVRNQSQRNPDFFIPLLNQFKPIIFMGDPIEAV